MISHLEYALDASVPTQRTLRLRIGGADVALVCDRIAARLRRSAEIRGFRRGKAPLAVVRSQLWSRITGESFDRLKSDALEQVLKKLDEADRPFLPPEVLDRESVKLSYGRDLAFAVKYYVDPTGVTHNPTHPEAKQGSVLRGAQIPRPGAANPIKLPGWDK